MPTVRQNAVCGIAIIAKILPAQGFASLIPNSLATIEKVLTGPSGSDEEKAAVENAMTALGVVALKHSKDQTQINKFLNALPLSGEDENKEAFDYFLEHYE